jgi:Domain of unknown function (DUF6969)
MAFEPSDLEISIDFAALGPDRLQFMVAAGRDAVECHRALAQTKDNIVGDLLRDVETFYEWNHYPDGDVYDPNSHAQFYFHTHPQELRGGEHGHFHTFMRPKGMLKDMTPAPLPDLEAPREENDALSHLVGISMDQYGVPIRIFTTNRWVTGEVWYAAGDVQRMVDLFIIDHTRPSWPVNRWVSAMICLFQPQIVQLLDARDAAVAAWETAHPGVNVYEDRELEITSVTPISIDAQLEEASRALAALS